MSAYCPYYDEPNSTLKVAPNSNGAYPGKREIETRTSTQTYLLMNWGWDGSYDTGEYTTSSDGVWDSYGDYQYKKEIYYNYK